MEVLKALGLFVLAKKRPRTDLCLNGSYRDDSQVLLGRWCHMTEQGEMPINFSMGGSVENWEKMLLIFQAFFAKQNKNSLNNS